ncbi:F0F1 ATP synthase subunit B [Actinocorallia longicatena]|uniref:ATP synthase subunit b n=1 Tax=Actinocorallia longicatena TaxID=111803 RepID=A0ABP6QIE9_9ACTN
MFLAEAAEHEPNIFLPHGAELVIGPIAFAIIFGLFAWKLLPKIVKTLDERSDLIEGGLKRSAEAEDEAKRTLEAYKAQLADARQEAARLREEAREQGAQIIAEMKEQAQVEARGIVENARAQIEAERAQALTSLRSEVGALSVDLAGRVVGESLEDEARQRRVVDRFLEELEAANASKVL